MRIKQDTITSTKIIIPTLVLFICSLSTGYADNFKNEHKFYKSVNNKSEEIEENYAVGELIMTENVRITGDMIEGYKDQRFSLGTFCAYTLQGAGNHKFPVRVTSSQGKFAAHGLNYQGDLPYTVYVNNIKINYGQINYITANNKPGSECQAFENIAIEFSKDTIRNAKAGAYALTLNFSAE
ncbi:hypothetical protein [Facilibium subflavum]|uniref:hypothetical protein n=1 Tax=Facilibium subflavum TaxID=2219058 RepID=UPI000E658844|nr:hypothetical protein [Facilibium subflavum]